MTRRTNQYFLFVFIYFPLVSLLLAPLLTKFLPISEIWGDILLQFLIFLPMLAIYVKSEKASAKDCFSLRPISWKNALLCLGIAYCALPLVSLIVVLTTPLQPNLAEEAMQAYTNDAFLPMLFLMAVQPAVFEELLFRGAALHGYRQLGTKGAPLMSALMFAMLHMNLQQALYAFALGCVFAFLVERTGSIFASILPHFLINGMNCAAMYFAKPQEGVVEETTFLQDILSAGLQCLIFLPFLALLLHLFLRHNPKPVLALPADTSQPKEKVFTVSFWIIIAIFLFLGVIPNLYLFVK